MPELVDRAAQLYGDRLALLSRENRETFAELRGRVRRAAGGMRVAPGDRVLIVAGNSLETVHAFLGAVYAGAVAAVVNPELTESELDYLRQDLEPALELQAPEPGPERDPVEADPLAPAGIVYTSGTTSRPKGVQIRHAAYTETGHSFPSWFGLGQDERLWACLPLFHINAQAYSLMASLWHGFPLALSERFSASRFWREAAELEVTHVNLIGAMLSFLARQPEPAWAEHRLRRIYTAPVPPPTELSQLERRFRVRIVTGYGMSENTFGTAESSTSRGKAGSIGRARQPVEGAFVNELRIDADGELCFRNPLLTPGYWRAPEITGRTIVDGWLHTGDLGRVDADGDVFLSGRKKEMIRRRGENIAPGEVEDALLAHPAVVQAAVFGVPSAYTEEEVVAAVVLGSGVTADEAALKDFARSRLAAYKVPAEIVFREGLPMTATMRVAKDRLRQEYLAAKPR